MNNIEENFKYKNLYLIPLIIGLLVAIFTPTDIFKISYIKDFVGVIAKIVPMVSHIQGEYELNQVSQFYFSIIWLMTPFIFISLKINVDKDKASLITLKHKLILIFLVVPLFILGSLFLFLYGFDPTNINNKYAVVLHTRFGMGLFGYLIIYGAVGMLKLALAILSQFLFRKA